MKPLNPFGRTARVLAAAAALALAGPLQAQEPPLGAPAPPAPAPECDCAWGFSDAHPLPGMFRFGRARLGVELGEDISAAGRPGVRLANVEEGTPAHRAGLRAGDVVVSLDGAALGEDATHRLLEIMADVEPGDTVDVGYVREGRTATARVVTDRSRGVSVFSYGDAPAVRAFPRIEMDGGRVFGPDMRVHLRQMLGGGLDMVPMNEELGRYFDVTEGVLVTSVEEDTELGLRAGDVILSIGGRSVRDPAHARSILASYRPDETISFEIVRERRRTTVTGTRG